MSIEPEALSAAAPVPPALAAMLFRLAEPGAVLTSRPARGSSRASNAIDFCLMSPQAGVRRAAVTRAEIDAAVAGGWLTESLAGWALTVAGAATVRRLRAAGWRPDAAPSTAAAAGPVPAVNDLESPLAWLFRRRTRTGEPFLSQLEFDAGERLRVDFTLAQMMPRVTSSWSPASVSHRTARGPARADQMSDAVVAARQRLTKALDAVGPELAEILLDVCCFLKGLERLERERDWPARAAKIPLQLGLRALSRHYWPRRARHEAATDIRTWLAPPSEELAEAAPTGCST